MLRDATMDDVDEEDDARVCVFAIPMRHNFEGVVFGSENKAVNDWVVGFMWSNSSKRMMLSMASAREVK